MTVDRERAAHRVDAEHLELGGGLEVLLAAALERVAPGGVLEIRTPSRAVALELPGTFRDLLRFIEVHAPDAATAAAARLAHRDERRHVHFGISNIRRSVSIDPDTVGPLVAAAETRAAKLVSLSGLSPILVEALTIMAARSIQPADLSDAAADVHALMQTMERNRLRRLQACGFDAATARHLSDLHTPNLM